MKIWKMNEKQQLFRELNKINPNILQVYTAMMIFALSGFQNALNYINDLKQFK